MALEIVAEARAEWGYVTDIIARAFRAHRELSSGGRRLVAETVYGLIRMDRRLDLIADELVAASERAGGSDVTTLSPLARDELKLLVYEARTGVPPAALAAEAQRILRAPVDMERAAAEDAGLGRRTGLEREAARLSYPPWLIEMFAADMGEQEALAVAEAMNRRAPLAVRVNTARIGREALIARLAEEHVVAHPTQLSPVGLLFETRVNAFGLSAFQEGLFR